MSYPGRAYGRGPRGRSRMGCTARLVIALIFVAFGVIQFLASTDVVKNPYTGEEQRLALTPKQEIALGLNSVPKMIQMHGGQHPNPQAQATVDRVGAKLVANVHRLARHEGKTIDYPFEFHLLADPKMINAFALPGGQIFITAALYNHLQNEDQLAGVLGHEVGHVVAKHSNEQMSKSGLLKSVGTGIGVAVGADNMGNQVSAMVNQVLATRYGRSDEYESDEIGAWLMYYAGYNPREILGVLEILKRAASGPRPPEMLSTHPHPENRIEQIKIVLQKIPKSLR